MGTQVVSAVLVRQIGCKNVGFFLDDWLQTISLTTRLKKESK
jgi:hypothetical protein